MTTGYRISGERKQDIGHRQYYCLVMKSVHRQARNSEHYELQDDQDIRVPSTFHSNLLDYTFQLYNVHQLHPVRFHCITSPASPSFRRKKLPRHARSQPSANPDRCSVSHCISAAHPSSAQNECVSYRSTNRDTLFHLSRPIPSRGVLAPRLQPSSGMATRLCTEYNNAKMHIPLRYGSLGFRAVWKKSQKAYV